MVTAAALVELIGPWADGADPLNEQLADALARAIEIGMLPAGTKLPAERELARELALSRTTIVAAYDRLRLAGLATEPPGQRYPRRDPPPGVVRPHPDTCRRIPIPRRRSGSRARRRGPEIPRTGSSSTMPTRSSSRSAPCLPARPSRAASRPHCETTCRHSSTRWATTHSGGPGSVSAIAAYLARLGVPTDPDQILVTNGAQQAVHLIGSQIGGPGSAVVLENPTYIGAIDAFRTTGNRLLPMPVDPDGPRVDMAGLARGERACPARLRRADLPQPDRRHDARGTPP